MAGTLESCYAFLSLEYCGILIFVRGLARGRVDGFSIGRYEEKRVSFDLNAAKFESGAMRFSGGVGGGGIAPALEPFQNKDSFLVLILLETVNGKLKILQNRSKNRF